MLLKTSIDLARFFAQPSERAIQISTSIKANESTPFWKDERF